MEPNIRNNTNKDLRMIRNLLLLLLFLAVSFPNISAKPTENEHLKHLLILSGKSLNYSSSITEDQIIGLCSKAESLAREKKDYDNLFRIEQIAVNAYCLKGNIGLAIDKARQMYEQARALDNQLGIALAFQALGDTYLHSNQNVQAFQAFADAEKILESNDDKLVKLRLIIQQMQVATNQNQMETLQDYLLKARKLLEYTDLPDKRSYVFHLLFYQTIYNICTKNAESARTSLEQINRLYGNDKAFVRGCLHLTFRYYELIGEYEKALAYCDSTLTVVASGGNMNEYKFLLSNKAVLLEKNNMKVEACELYARSFSLSDSLNKQSYAQQIDSLHVAYWVDQIALENAAAHNTLLAWILGSSLLILIIAILFIVKIKKQNRALLDSKNQLKNMQQEASDSYQTKSLFLSNMSHELRTPLNGIVGFSEILATGMEIDDETKEQFGSLIKQNADLLMKLFNDVATFSALKDSNIQFDFAKCDATLLCRNVLDTVDKVKRTAAEINFTSSVDHLEINTDSGRLQQVLINLLINATKFTPQGRITLKLDVNEQHEAQFSIEDTGCGIPLEKQPHIFERFEKLHEGVQGAGLGLSICQLIINYVGGRIWIDSSYTDGARFVFTHPLNQPSESTK